MFSPCQAASKYFTGTFQQILKVFHRRKLATKKTVFFTARLCRGGHAKCSEKLEKAGTVDLKKHPARKVGTRSRQCGPKVAGRLAFSSTPNPRIYSILGRVIFIHHQCWEVLPFCRFQRQRCIKIRVLRAQDFYTPLALKTVKGQHLPALVVYKKSVSQFLVDVSNFFFNFFFCSGAGEKEEASGEVAAGSVLNKNTGRGGGFRGEGVGGGTALGECLWGGRGGG